jgi:hypothetical protein
MKIDGRCHCGFITFEAEIDLEKVWLCHCTERVSSRSADLVPAPIWSELPQSEGRSNGCRLTVLLRSSAEHQGL